MKRKFFSRIFGLVLTAVLALSGCTAREEGGVQVENVIPTEKIEGS